MVNRILLIVLLIIAGACSSPRYLPPVNQVDVNEYGSYIKLVKKANHQKLNGELISVDNTRLIVLSENTKQCEVIPIEDVKLFKLRYAEAKHYGWTIPLFTLSTISHGFYLIFTAPANLSTTISATVGGEKAFQYNKKDINYKYLQMFARFPQGIPSSIDLKKIQ